MKKQQQSKSEAKSGDGSAQPSWEQMLFQLLLYRARNDGSSSVPRRTYCEIDLGNGKKKKKVDLGQFVTNMRRYKQLLSKDTAGEEEDGEGAAEARAEAASALTPERIEVLESIGFAWRNPNSSGSSFRHAQWEERYNELVQHHARHGDCEPRDNPRLMSWCAQQRQTNNVATGTKVAIGASARRVMGLSDETVQGSKRRDDLKQGQAFKEVWEKRKAKLDELGFVWIKYSNRASWEDRLESLKRYKAENGHCNVPQHYALDKALGKWCNRQRTEYLHYTEGKKTPMTEERISLLESVGFEWVMTKRHSKHKFGQLDYEEEGDS